ncbi:MAG: hypothetical protein FVQ82_15875 [Planctomycetes bacterium]|nr:hypothetical protein [Planctomycetota bacterium]
MNDNKSPTSKKTIDLATFATRRVGKDLVIKTIGVFKLKLRCDSNSHTKGTINIAGKTLPILSNQYSTSLSKNEIDKDSCILLLDANQSFLDYRVGILVDSVAEIAKVAKDFI